MLSDALTPIFSHLDENKSKGLALQFLLHEIFDAYHTCGLCQELVKKEDAHSQKNLSLLVTKLFSASDDDIQNVRLGHISRILHYLSVLYKEKASGFSFYTFFKTLMKNPPSSEENFGDICSDLLSSFESVLKTIAPLFEECKGDENVQLALLQYKARLIKLLPDIYTPIFSSNEKAMKKMISEGYKKRGFTTFIEDHEYL